jgi:hypothetical protein
MSRTPMRMYVLVFSWGEAARRRICKYDSDNDDKMTERSMTMFIWQQAGS